MPSVSMVKQRKQEQQAIALRNDLLREAGWPLERRLKLLGGALKVYERQLTAKKAVIVEQQVEYVEDNQAQLRAAEAITTLEGVNVGKSQEGGSTGPISITINAPWFQPEPTISGGHGVIDVSHSSNPLIGNESP